MSRTHFREIAVVFAVLCSTTVCQSSESTIPINDPTDNEGSDQSDVLVDEPDSDTIDIVDLSLDEATDPSDLPVHLPDPIDVDDLSFDESTDPTDSPVDGFDPIDDMALDEGTDPTDPPVDGFDPIDDMALDEGDEGTDPTDSPVDNSDIIDIGCSHIDTLCVDDTAGLNQEFATLQAAADAVAPGQTVVVFDGHYAGFDLETGGSSEARITFRGAGDGAVIDSDGPEGYGVFLKNVSFVTVEGLRVTGVSGRGIAHRRATAENPVSGLIIRNNVVENTTREGMYLSQVSNSLVEGNEISNSGTNGTHGIYLSNAGSDGTTLRGNHIWGSAVAGIHLNGDLSVGGDGIISGVVVEGNIIHDNGQNGLNMDGVQDSVVRNNVIYGNDLNGIRAYAIDGAEGPRGLVIVNNTIHVPDDAYWCIRITEDEGDNVAFNNILMNDSSSSGSIALDNTQGFASDHNAVVNGFSPDRGDTYLDLSDWQALGYDANSFVTTPQDLFVNASAGNYRLKSGSPAINAGIATFASQSAPSVDVDGRARSDTPDVGAYETP